MELGQAKPVRKKKEFTILTFCTTNHRELEKIPPNLFAIHLKLDRLRLDEYTQQQNDLKDWDGKRQLVIT